MSKTDEELMNEIMEEVHNLQDSIQKLCPEVIGKSQYPSIQEMGDDMSKLIEHRIKLLSDYSKKDNVHKA